MTKIDDLFALGTSTWLDDLSRDRIKSGNLAEVLKTKSVVGVTTNPAIFAAAMTKGDAYDAQLAQLKEEGKAEDVNEAAYAMMIDDVREACEILKPIYEKSDGKDGRVSIEVDPRISADYDATVEQARALWKKIDQPNLMIKIPATDESIPAITTVLSEGISVNVTLIFSVARYRQVIEAFIAGVTKAAENGVDVSKIHSVASFFVSRMDTEVDKRLDAIGSEEAVALKGKAGVANARLAYGLYLAALEAKKDELPAGTNLQRPLWASTGVKNPDYSKTLYVDELAGPNTVNTMPEGTIDAVLAESNLRGDTLTGTQDEAQKVFDDLAAVGIDMGDVVRVLEQEGVDKFVAAWNDLLDTLSVKLN